MDNLDINKLKAQSEEIKSNLDYFATLGQPIVNEYSKDLDDKVMAIKTYLNRVRELNLPFDVPSLQKICIDLASTIYFTSDKLEHLGLLEDMSSIKYKDKYNSAYLTKQGDHDAGTKYTVEQLRNYAEQEALSEKLINFIYSHAAKIIKGKIDAAQDLLKSCSKSLSAEIESAKAAGYSNKWSM